MVVPSDRSFQYMQLSSAIKFDHSPVRDYIMNIYIAQGAIMPNRFAITRIFPFMHAYNRYMSEL